MCHRPVGPIHFPGLLPNQQSVDKNIWRVFINHSVVSGVVVRGEGSVRGPTTRINWTLSSIRLTATLSNAAITTMTRIAPIKCSVESPAERRRCMHAARRSGPKLSSPFSSCLEKAPSCNAETARPSTGMKRPRS